MRTAAGSSRLQSTPLVAYSRHILAKIKRPGKLVALLWQGRQDSGLVLLRETMLEASFCAWFLYAEPATMIFAFGKSLLQVQVEFP